MLRKLQKNKRPFFYLFASLAVFASLLVNFHLWQTNKEQKGLIEKLNKQLEMLKEEGFKVVEVLDGDTFKLDSGQRVRLADIDAPGLSFCLGKEAKDRLSQLILGKKVILREIRKDKFGRTLALVYQGDKFINKIMLEEGWGRYDSTQTSKDKLLLQSAREAREKKRGVWQYCTQTTPPNPRCAIKGNIEKHYGRKVYHFPGCAGYNVVVVELDRGERWFCSEKEAQAAGFVKSEKCYGKKWQP